MPGHDVGGSVRQSRGHAEDKIVHEKDAQGPHQQSQFGTL